jgi:hypothetical protein
MIRTGKSGKDVEEMVVVSMNVLVQFFLVGTEENDHRSLTSNLGLSEYEAGVLTSQ